MSKISQFLCFSLVIVVFTTVEFANQGDNLIENDTTQVKIQTPQSGPFYNGRKEGWYDYLQAPKKLASKKKKEKKQHLKLKLTDYTVKRLWNMYPDKFKALQTQFLKQAVQHPTEQNVVAYMTLADIARRKALAFTNVFTMVSQQHPELTTQGNYPTNTPGQIALVRMRMQEEGQTIRNNRDDFALIMFTQQGCGYCKAQKSILSYFVDKYGWPVRDVDIHQKPNLAARFNITTTPTILLVSKQSQKYMPISVGVITMSDLEDRLFRSIRYMKGKITSKQWFMYNFQRGTSEDASKPTY